MVKRTAGRLTALICILILIMPAAFPVGAAAEITPITSFPWTETLTFTEDDTFVDGNNHFFKFSFTLTQETDLYFEKTEGIYLVWFSVMHEGELVAEPSLTLDTTLDAGDYELWISDGGGLVAIGTNFTVTVGGTATATPQPIPVTPIVGFPWTEDITFVASNIYIEPSWDPDCHLLKFSFTLTEETRLHIYQTAGDGNVYFSVWQEGSSIDQDYELVLVLAPGNYELWIDDDYYLANNTAAEMNATVCVEALVQPSFTVTPITLPWTESLVFDEQNSFIYYEYSTDFRWMAFSFSLEETTALEFTQACADGTAWARLRTAGEEKAISYDSMFEIILEAGDYELWIKDDGFFRSEGYALETEVSLTVIPLSYIMDDIIAEIEGFDHGGDGTLSATAQDNVITVTGAVTGAKGFELYIPGGVKVVWRAEFSGESYIGNALMKIYGPGTFEVAEGAVINNSRDDVPTLFSESALLVTGGSVTTTGDRAAAIWVDYINLIITGGVVSNADTDSDGYAIAGGFVFYLTGTVTGNLETDFSIELDRLGINAAWDGTNNGMKITLGSDMPDLDITWDLSGSRPFIVIREPESGETLRVPWGYLVGGYTVLQHFGKFTGSGTRAAIVDALSGEFESLWLKDVEVAASNYTIEEGSTKIILSEAYLNTLANGTYTFTALFEHGQVQLTLTVSRTPATGDGDTLMIWMMVSGLALAALAVTATAELRRRKRDQ